MEKFKEIISNFNIQGQVIEIKPLGNGLINDTYKVTTKGNDPDYVLQRINHTIFQDVEMLQKNIEAVTNHLRKKLEEKGETDIDRKVLNFIKVKDSDKTYYFDSEKYWRVSVFISNAKTYETVNPEFSYFAGRAFGEFESMLADIDIELGETIPNFHNLEFRLEQLKEAARKDAVGRVESVKDIIEDINANAARMCKAETLYRRGLLPKRICHCDTKVNNMLFDESGKVLCVIDLDTVMPNYIFSDFGDFLRAAANTVAEDCPDLDKVDFNMEIFKYFAKGYIEGTSTFLTPVEKENLPYAACLFPFMQGVRFFIDYLNGDKYYKIKYPEHNLVRAKNQLKLFHSAISKIGEMEKIINS